MTNCPFTADAVRYTHDVREWGITTSPLASVTVWHESLGALGRAIRWNADFRPGDDSPEALHLRKVVNSKTKNALLRVFTESTLLLIHLDVEDPEAAFVAEYERAAAKHPGMTLDADGHTDESRFYALAEEVGEVSASLTYDNTRGTGHGADTIAEVTQVGALALAWLTRYQDGENR
nr:MAG TPA: hypothetical protein [Bacteriophage sp.]